MNNNKDYIGAKGHVGDPQGIPAFTEMEKAINMQMEVIQIARKQPGFTDYDFVPLIEALKTLEILKIKNDVTNKLIGGK